MQDAPEYVKQIQLDIWMSETMSERLEQFIIDNDALFKLWKEARKKISPGINNDADLFGYNLHPKNKCGLLLQFSAVPKQVTINCLRNMQQQLA